mmetsp:Transcript_21119/g.33698  ORF Transcript_21119/g.33698 Transcript_21119/m.33698 type:complete len:262 (+) Transcript_21119:2-787(+)
MEEMRQDTMRRLSITQQSNGAWSEDKSVTEIISARPACEDAETDIGDSVSVAPGIVLPGNVSQFVQDEVSRLVGAQADAFTKIQQQIEELQRQNKLLEEKNKHGSTPPANSTPLAEDAKAMAAFQNCPSPITPGMSQQGSKSSRQNRQSLAGLDSNDSMRKPRRSIAAEALMNTLPREEVPASEQNKQRKWWAEQRNFLMEDLYSLNQSPTPNRNKARRQSQGGPLASVGKALGPAFEQAKSEEVEWVVDCQKSASRKSVQ